MHLTRDNAPLWMVELDKQLLRGKHVLLYGNVEDRFILPESGEVASLPDFLNQYFCEAGYELVGHYDIVDGVQLADAETMGPLFAALANPRGTPPRAPSPNRAETETRAAQEDPAQASPPPEQRNEPQSGSALTLQRQQSSRRTPGKTSQEQDRQNENRQDASRQSASRQSANRQTDSRFLPPGTAFPAIRRVLEQPHTPSAIMLEFSDKLVSDPQRQDQQERPLLVQLKKMLDEAAELTQGRLAGRRNALVIVASHLAGLPSWFYQDHPLLALIRVPHPSLEERTRFVQQFLPHFAGGSDIEDGDVPRIVEQFAELTDGLTIWDLMALGNTSSTEQLPISSPSSLANLISYYKYGEREDPWEKFNEDKVRQAPELIERRVIGQSEPVTAIVDMLVTARIGITLAQSTAGTGKPKGIFFFVGPTGVGKTELAKALAELIFGDEDRMQRFDMSEYAEQHAAEKLTGSPPGFVGYEEGGQLTNFVRENPFSLLLFDEIEKADGRVMDKFLQILEDGRLTDSKGQTVYFSQSVIIFTSNIGSDKLQLGEEPVSDGNPPYRAIRDFYLAAVRRHFVAKLKRPEILNRFGDNILVFDVLRPQYVRGICEKFLNSLKFSAREKRGLELEFTEPGVREMVSTAMARGENLKFGGRRIRTLLEERVEKPLNRWVFWRNPASGTVLQVGTSGADNSLIVNGEEVVASLASDAPKRE